MVGGLSGSPTDGWAWMLAFHDWRAAEGSGRIGEVPSGLFAALLEKKILLYCLFSLIVHKKTRAL